MSELDAQPLETMDVLLQPTIEEKTEAAPQAAATQTTGAGNYALVALNLAKSSGIYAVGMLASPLVSLLLTPFLAYQLSPTDYGVQTVLMTMVGLAVVVTQLGLSVAFFRVYNYEFTDPDDRRVVLATVMGLLFLVSLLAAIVTVLLAPTLAGLLLGNSSLGGLVILACYVVVVQNLTVPALCWLRAENRPVFFSLLYSGNVLILLGATLALVGLLHWGVAGSLVAIGSGYAGIALFTLPLILRRSTWRLRTDITWSLLTFGGPQVLSYISYWVLQLSDRYLLSLFVSLAQTASYAVAYSLGSVLATLVITPFVLAWPSVMFSVARRNDAPYIFQTVFRWFSLVLLLAAFGISIAGSLVLDWLFPATYHAAAPVIPIVAESIIFYGLYNVFMTGASIRRKTWMPAVFSGLAACVNLGLNLVLIPHFGTMGAAASTLIAYIVLALVAYLANQRIYPIPYEIGRFLLALLSGVILYLAADSLAPSWGGFWHWPVTLGSLLLYGGVCLLFLGRETRPLLARGASLLSRIASARRVS